jgi:hypothetical protein
MRYQVAKVVLSVGQHTCTNRWGARAAGTQQSTSRRLRIAHEHVAHRVKQPGPLSHELVEEVRGQMVLIRSLHSAAAKSSGDSVTS